MAEAVALFGVAGTVVTLAAEGLKLWHTLDLYCEQVKYSNEEVQGIARDVKDTAVVLEQLGANMKLEEEMNSTIAFNPASSHESSLHRHV